jgi:Zn-dependent protease with chaperone function
MFDVDTWILWAIAGTIWILFALFAWAIVHGGTRDNDDD